MDIQKLYEEYSFLNITFNHFKNLFLDGNYKSIYNYIHNEIEINGDISIIINYIYTYINLNDPITSLNNFTEFLNKAKIEVNDGIYNQICEKSSILEECIRKILTDKKVDNLTKESLELLEIYYEKYSDIPYNSYEIIDYNMDPITDYPTSSFFSEAKRLPLLSEEETYELIEKYKKTKDKSARDKLINHNLKLIFPIARKYSESSGIEFEDLVLEGSLGLMKAVEEYDYEKAKFSTFATLCIFQKISRYTYDYGKIIRIPVYKQEKIRKYKRVKSEIIAKTGEKPTDEEMAKILGEPLEDIQEYRKLSVPTKSLNEYIADDGDDEIGDFVADEEQLTPEEKMIETFHPELKDALDKLSDVQRSVIELRYGLNNGKCYTLEEICDELYTLKIKDTKITSERTRQIEVKALEKLKEYLNKDKQKKKRIIDENSNEYTIEKKYKQFISFIIAIDSEILTEILYNLDENSNNILLQIYGDKIKENIYTAINDKKIKKTIALKIFSKMTRELDIIVSKNIIDNPQLVTLPSSIYYVCSNKKISPDKLDIVLDRLSVEDRYFLSKYYNIYSNTGEKYDKPINNSDKVKLINILKKIETELKIKIYKKKK